MTITNYSRVFDATMSRKGNANPAKTFRNFQDNAIFTRDTLANLKAMYEKDKAEVLRDYSTNKASEMLAKLQRYYNMAHDTAESYLRERLDAVVQSKRDAVKAACKAPTEEDLRLLSALKMRSNLTDSDVIHAAEQMSNNMVSLGTLADIAAAAGVNVPVPTAEIAEEEIENARLLCEDMIRFVDSPDSGLTYAANCFYRFPDAETHVSIMFSELDNSVFTSEQLQKKIEAAKFNTAAVTERYANASEVELREGNYLANIAMQFGVKIADIEAANPGVNLENLHPGDHVIIPSTKMKMYSGKGWATPDQVSPVQAPGSKLDPDVHRSEGQLRTAIKADGKGPGSTVTIGD